MKRYLFISNSNKPSNEESKSRDSLRLGNVRKPCVDTAHELGYEVWVGINREKPEELSVQCDYPIYLYDSHTYRNIFGFKDNLIAFRNCMKVLRQGNFDVIHCNTPIGGIIGRFCGKIAKIRKVIYTAHGFHFYKGAPLLNRTILKWGEMIMAHWTDAIITMNEEYYKAASKFKLRNGGKVFKVHGVGIILADYQNMTVDRKRNREKLGLKDSDIVCISAGDLILRKNYETAIEAISKTDRENLHYLICGVGPEKEKLEALANEKGVSGRVHFLGFRTDIRELMASSDIFLFSTLQEGLPRSMMEAMACGLPCVASSIRGNIDLIEDGVNGFLCSSTDAKEFACALKKLYDDSNLRSDMGNRNIQIIKEYDIEVVKKEIQDIYLEVLSDNA